MKKLLIISIVLFVAGLGLILLGDPVISLAGGNAPTGNSGFSQLPGPNSTSTNLPSGCTQQNGGVVCKNVPIGSGDLYAVWLTLAGIGLSGVGVFLTAVEAISKSQQPFQTKTVT